MYTNRKKEDKQGNDKMIKKIENICTEEERVVPTTQPSHCSPHRPPSPDQLSNAMVLRN